MRHGDEVTALDVREISLQLVRASVPIGIESEFPASPAYRDDIFTMPASDMGNSMSKEWAIVRPDEPGAALDLFQPNMALLLR
jgi:hypothetical protein